MSIYRSTLVPFHIGSMFCFCSVWRCAGDKRFGSSLLCGLFHLQITLSILKQEFTTGITRLRNWLDSSTVCYRRSSKWDDYVLPDHSEFPPNADGESLGGTRVLAALNKIGSSYLKQEFRRDARRFLEEFTFSVLSTVSASSKIGRGLSCFCPAIIIGGDDHAPLHLLGLLLDGLLDRG